MPDFFDGVPVPEPSAVNGFATNAIARWSEHRSEDSVATALADADARLYLFIDDKALLRGLNPLFTAAEAAALGGTFADALLLGWTSSGPRLAVTLPEGTQIDPERIAQSDLRALAMAGQIDAEHLGAMALARCLIAWHAGHRFCGRCGAPTRVAIGGFRRDCTACGTEHFPRTDPVVIMLAIHRAADGTERVLLGRQARFAPGMYSCLAGFLEPGETIEDAVRRETGEEAGIRIGRVRYYSSQPWPFPHSLMIGCHAEALSVDIERDEEELEDCRWFGRDEVRAMMAGTHPEGLKVPFPMAIANRLIVAWAEG